MGVAGGTSTGDANASNGVPHESSLQAALDARDSEGDVERGRERSRKLEVAAAGLGAALDPFWD